MSDEKKKPDWPLVPDPSHPVVQEVQVRGPNDSSRPQPKVINPAVGESVPFEDCIAGARLIWRQEQLDKLDDEKAVKAFLSARKEKKLKKQPAVTK